MEESKKLVHTKQTVTEKLKLGIAPFTNCMDVFGMISKVLFQVDNKSCYEFNNGRVASRNSGQETVSRKLGIQICFYVGM